MPHSHLVILYKPGCSGSVHCTPVSQVPSPSVRMASEELLLQMGGFLRVMQWMVRCNLERKYRFCGVAEHCQSKRSVFEALRIQSLSKPMCEMQLWLHPGIS